MNKLKNFVFALPLLLASSFQLEATPLMYGSNSAGHIAINNRILADVNGKAISVIDVTKKMDILFYREFPEYSESLQAKFQFYQAHWKRTLQELVDKELILADAEENKLSITSGEIRQEMETMFGPSIITNLDKIGISFDEATKIVQGDITLQRMLYIRVHGKALRSVTPLDVRQHYDEYAMANIAPTEWIYQVITVRNKNKSDALEVANAAHYLLTEQEVALNDLQSEMIKALRPTNKSQLTISEELHHDEKNASDAYKAVLSAMTPNTYSTPAEQKSRTKETVFRLFFLKEMIPGGAPAFADVQVKLKNELLEKIIAAESKAYITRLRKHYNLQESSQENFQPFSLQQQ